MAMKLDEKTLEIIKKVESLGYRVEVEKIKGRTKIAAIAPDGDEEWGIAATPYEAAIQLLLYINSASNQ